MILTQLPDAPPLRRKEILRYAGVQGDAPLLEPLIDSCLAELEGRLHYKICYGIFPITMREGMPSPGFAVAPSADLARNLSGCPRVLLFAATLGLEIDRLIARYGRTEPSRALLLQAIGAERIEALCDAFEAQIEEPHAPRFSPGYGDFSLEAQREIFRVLDCPRRIGLTLNESLLMSPTKSVTALIGLKNR